MRLTSIYIVFLLSSLLISVDYKTNNVLLRNVVSKSDLSLNSNEGKMYFNNIPFTGIGISYYPTGEIEEKITYIKGVRSGSRTKWFIDGNKSFEAKYKENKLHGAVSSWWRNGNLRSQANFQSGKLNGVAMQWYESGVLFKKLTLVDGKEQGLQQAWRENGKLYTNYEAKDGRIFGLKRANLCFELEDEIVQINE
ncbi:MAG: hypothetical protein BalsKO_16720 [Balneolaceae bacterium]